MDKSLESHNWQRLNNEVEKLNKLLTSKNIKSRRTSFPLNKTKAKINKVQQPRTRWLQEVLKQISLKDFLKNKNGWGGLQWDQYYANTKTRKNTARITDRYPWWILKEKFSTKYYLMLMCWIQQQDICYMYVNNYISCPNYVSCSCH